MTDPTLEARVAKLEERMWWAYFSLWCLFFSMALLFIVGCSDRCTDKTCQEPAKPDIAITIPVPPAPSRAIIDATGETGECLDFTHSELGRCALPYGFDGAEVLRRLDALEHRAAEAR